MLFAVVESVRPLWQHVWLVHQGRAENFSGNDSDEVTLLLQDARSAVVQSDRAVLYRQAQRQITEDATMLFIVFPQTIQALTSALEWPQYADGAFRLHCPRFF